jgi:glycosyltransferase involved in cell wall biosynthesis
MTVCGRCNRSYPSPVFPIVCGCGAVLRDELDGANPVNPWAIIHRRLALASLEPESWDAEREQHWYASEWLPKLPRICRVGCYDKWDALTNALPIDWSTAEAAERSLWKLHNEVSAKHVRRVDRPTKTFDDARRIWRGPRVVFLADSYSTVGGTETFHRTLLPRLRERINVAAFVATRWHTGDPRPLKVPYTTGLRGAAEAVANADVVVSWAVPLGKLFGDRPRPRVIAVHHSDPLQHWAHDYISANLRWTDRIVCVHPGITKRFPEAVYIPNAIDPSRIVPTDSTHSIPASAKLIFWNHRSAPEKRPLMMLDIFAGLPEDYWLAMAGAGPLDPAIRAAVAKLEPSFRDRVRLLGPIDSPADWLAIADVFVSLVTVEGFGLAVAEALAAGVPTISTPTGIATGRALTLPIDSPVEFWRTAICNPPPRRRFAEFSDVDAFVSAWENLIRETFDAAR